MTCLRNYVRNMFLRDFAHKMWVCRFWFNLNLFWKVCFTVKQAWLHTYVLGKWFPKTFWKYAWWKTHVPKTVWGNHICVSQPDFHKWFAIIFGAPFLSIMENHVWKLSILLFENSLSFRYLFLLVLFRSVPLYFVHNMLGTDFWHYLIIAHAV